MNADCTYHNSYVRDCVKWLAQGNWLMFADGPTNDTTLWLWFWLNDKSQHPQPEGAD